MFFDQAKIFVKGGDGGNGMVAFRREKYIPEGGPYGGDGGRGGNVILRVDEGLRTLVDFRYKRHHKADKGENGASKNMHGRKGEDLTIRVPMGTVVKDTETGEVLADLLEAGQETIIAKGGRGGKGNSRFATSLNKAPGYAEKGDPGEEHWLQLELKLIADVGLVGFPNVGKSTIISKVSAAKPKIADYHFTTLVPNLGVVKVADGFSFVLADIPGLIEGAHTGAGLGHEFLRHTERTRLLIHVVDVSGVEERDPLEDYYAINRELELYNPKLARRKQLIAANKMDLPLAQANLERLQAELGSEAEIFPISAVSGEGLEALIHRVAQVVPEIIDEPIVETVEKITKLENAPRFTITQQDGIFQVGGKELELHFDRTDFNNEESVKRFQSIIRLMGIEDALRGEGAKEGDVVRVKDMEFDFMD
ncbi:MAG: GTPase ObgE [Carboxydocellales bacterium]